MLYRGLSASDLCGVADVAGQRWGCAAGRAGVGGNAGCGAMGFSLGDMFLSALLFTNAAAILHEKRFLNQCEWQ